MFRTMRQIRQQLSQAECQEILNRSTSGTLAVNGDDGYPYIVPVNYIYLNNKIYIHGAKKGHKIDAITNNNKVSFCVIGEESIVPEKFTATYKSVIAFGRATVLEDPDIIFNAIDQLALKYSPDESEDKRKAEIQKEWDGMAVIKISIEHMTGKQAIELLNRV